MPFIPTPTQPASPNPLPESNEPLTSGQVDDWNLNDGSAFSWPQDQIPPPQALHTNLVNVEQDTTASSVGGVNPRLPVPGRAPAHKQASDYKCETCGWQVKEGGDPKNFAEDLHRPTFACPHISCKRSFSRFINLLKHIERSHEDDTAAER